MGLKARDGPLQQRRVVEQVGAGVAGNGDFREREDADVFALARSSGR